MLISAPLINMLQTQGFGFKSSNLLSDESYHFACYTYVDDTDLIHNGNANTTPSEMVAEMQRILDHWAGGLRATGGALVPSKSYWYDIAFKWNQPKSTWEYKTMQELPGSLTLHDHLQQLVTIRRMDVHQANETLGLWIAANGNKRAQIQALRNSIVRWTGKISTKQLTKVEAWLSLQIGVAKALRYPLTATCIPQKEYIKLDKELLKAALPALGFPPTFPFDITRAPPEVLGLGIPSIWHDQGIEHEAALLRHGNSQPLNTTGYLLRDEMATL
jgi:hypothetical protein